MVPLISAKRFVSTLRALRDSLGRIWDAAELKSRHNVTTLIRIKPAKRVRHQEGLMNCIRASVHNKASVPLLVL